jgi:tetratricopeptide (TPR) repeat protein
VTVVDDGTIPERRGSLSIDDEGTPTRRNVLIEDGILVGYLQDRLNARLMGVAPTGNGRRESFAHLPMPRMTNTLMEAGDRDPAEIIASVQRGLYAVNFGGGQVDITNGRFVFSASEAYLIENGRIGPPVKGATLIGNGPEAMTKISMIGNDLKLDAGVGVCGKDGQSVPVGVGQPTLRSIGWGAEFADFDSDGWVDLAVAAGSTFETEGAPRRLVPMPSFLFHNVKGEVFRHMADPSLPFAKPHVSRGLAVSDFDRDGDLDVAIVDLDGGLRLLRNDTRQGKAIHLHLHGPEGRRWSGVDGAVITAWVGKTPLRRTVSSASYLSQSTRVVHIGLGEAAYADRLTVRWPDGRTEEFGPVGSQARWALSPGGIPRFVNGELRGKERQLRFWDVHQEAMRLWKQAGDPQAAAARFREALSLDPLHEDARYYLASALAAAGETQAAVTELSILARLNPQSQRAFSRRAFLLASVARTRPELAEARSDALRAHSINPEETGALLLLGDIELLLGHDEEARRRLERVVQANPRSEAAHFGLAWLAWQRRDHAGARRHLEKVRAARGPEWKPKRATAEGDTARRFHEEGSLLKLESDLWDGASGPEQAFAGIMRRVAGLRQAAHRRGKGGGLDID